MERSKFSGKNTRDREIVIRSASSSTVYTAAEKNDIDVLIQLLEQGAEPDGINKNGWTPLHAASYNGNTSAVDILIQNGASVEAQTPETGYRPLHKAAERGFTEVISILLKNGANIEGPTAKNATPFFWGWTPLYHAAKNGHASVVDLLLQGGADGNRQTDAGWSTLHTASYYDRFSVVEKLMQPEYRANTELQIKADGYRPLHKAAEGGYVRIIRKLVSDGAEIDGLTYKTATPLYIACRDGRIEAVKLLLQLGASVEVAASGGWTPLYIAARNGYDEIVNVLLQAGVEKNHQTAEGWTSLHAACYWGKKMVVQRLLHEKVDIEIEIYLDGYRPLHKAVESGQNEITTLLLLENADVNAKTIGKDTPLYIAAKQGYLEVAQQLLDHSADLSIPNSKGWTILHAAVYSGNKEVIRLLLDRGANVNATNKEGQTAINLAESRDDQQLVELLAKHGKEPVPTIPNLSTITTGRAETLSERWFQKIEDLAAVLRPERRDPYPPVRIAIIDSGMQKDHPYSQSVKVFRDFVKDDSSLNSHGGTPNNPEISDEEIDNTKHGSNGIHLIGRLAPNADLYVVRVFQDSAASSNTQDLIAKAIRHARDNWKVDIITLASGFDQSHKEMEKEIYMAEASDILIFAAASNDGNQEYITFPANMVGHTMAMFACNGNVKVTNDFNPSPSRNSRYNFAVLGENIRINPFDTKPESGTSMSTFIGAAIAALVVDFSNQKDVKEFIEHREYVKSVAGMTAIFAEMAIAGSSQDYHCVAPWKLLSSSRVDRKRQREKLCHKISSLLEARYR
ncbi:ankyrin repeat-containing domain protein [Talaromyces proteolyticus]|uniref:Ankyrin repeat-containing domain protein n=1 Tax=Talaromyces proteolyticus TaxID=1131652 RepID=A0AAD4KIH0_9EURO|nr:ankyrin repeat-containing domain protein [Talaromyces proteolyticus]KAH8692296.1 ankyrin repeat-containing domain protein [Talaromyces proteolyticus]